MIANEAKKHHYVPQFYMRRFACADDENKVMVLERHRDVVVANRKLIDGIGYEERLSVARQSEARLLKSRVSVVLGQFDLERTIVCPEHAMERQAN